MGAIENLKNVFDWKSSENQSSHGITTPVNGLIDWSTFPSGFEHWITRGQTTLTVEATGTIISSNSTKTYFETYGDSQYGEFKSWIDSLGLKNYSANVPLDSKFYLPFGNVKLEIDCDHNPSYIAQNSVYTNRFKHYLSDATMFTLQTNTFDFTSSNYNSVSVGFIATHSVFGFAIICENTESKKIKCYIHEIELNDAFKTALGTDYTNGFSYEDDPNFGSGGVTQGLTGIVKTTSDTIHKNITPTSVSSCGFMNIYKVDTNSLKDLGKDLFGDVDIDFNECTMSAEEFTSFVNNSLNVVGIALPVVTEDEVKQNIGNEVSVGMSLHSIFKLLKASVRNLFSSQLVKYIVDCHIIPVSPVTSANLSNIQIGYREFTQQGLPCTTDYVNYNCGTINIPSRYQNFLDYSETKCKLFLPFCGIVDISPQYVFNHNLSIEYRFNIIDGSCIAYVMSDALNGELSIIGTYNGSACVHLPITGENYSSVLQGAMATVGGFMSNPLSGVSNLLSNASGFSGSMMSSNGYSSTSGFMGLRTPYIMIEYPIPQLPPRYFSDIGAMANIVMRVGDCKGFTKCRDVQLNTDVKYDIAIELKRILEEGVIV